MSRFGAGGPSCLLRVCVCGGGGLLAQRSESREGQHDRSGGRVPQQLAGLPGSWIRSHLFPELAAPGSQDFIVKRLIGDPPLGQFSCFCSSGFFPFLKILEDPENGVLGLVPILETKREKIFKRFTY